MKIYTESKTKSTVSTQISIGDVNLSQNATLDFINDTRYSGWNALHYSCFLGHHEIVTELIMLKADINITTRDDWSPFQLSIQKNHFKVI